MPETTKPSLNSVAETSLITLYIRATESQRPDALIKLDTRFERADNGQVEWYDLDLPDVIDLRRELIGGRARLWNATDTEDYAGRGRSIRCTL